MQSGISASAELLTAFQSFITTPTQRGLVATISHEAIQPGPTIPSNGSFLSDLANLTPHLKPDGALYILLRRADSLSSGVSAPGSLVAITYVPNAAPVRSKMLFASTRLTLLRELGSEHFGETVFVTEADELTEEGWARHEAHGEAANPLTQEERDLEGIKEQEALESRGTQGKSLAGGGKLALRAGEGVVEALGGLGQAGGENVVQLALDPKTETLTLISTSSANASSLADAIDAGSPRFIFYRHDDTASTPVLFISTCPSSSKIRERMLFAASRNQVIQYAQTEGGITIAKRLEVTNPDEVTEKVIQEELGESGKEEVPAAKSGFARPKRPGKR